MTNLVLTADIGGTNARLAAFDGDELLMSAQHATSGSEDLCDIFHAFTVELGRTPSVVVAAVAGPVQNNAVLMTNAGKWLRGTDIERATGAQQARVINDFAAAAWATAEIAPDALRVLQGQSVPPQGMRVVIGPGTGLGVGSLFQVAGRFYDMPGEGGHIGLAPANRRELEIFEALKSIWPDVFFGDSLTIEAEGLLSGVGLPKFYRAVCDANGVAPSDDASMRSLFDHARNGTDPQAVETIQIFKSHLARVAGDLGLSRWAEGGVFIVGGVAAKNPWLFDEAFVARFNEGGRFSDLRKQLNLYHLTNPDFGLLGARNYAKLEMNG